MCHAQLTRWCCVAWLLALVGCHREIEHVPLIDRKIAISDKFYDVQALTEQRAVVVGYGGKTINTLRLWAAAAPDFFDFQRFSSGDFVGALAETLSAESLTRVLYPDDSTSQGQGLRFVQEYFLVACSLADLVRRFRRTNSDWSKLPEKAAAE